MTNFPISFPDDSYRQPGWSSFDYDSLVDTHPKSVAFPPAEASLEK